MRVVDPRLRWPRSFFERDNETCSVQAQHVYNMTRSSKHAIKIYLVIGCIDASVHAPPPALVLPLATGATGLAWLHADNLHTQTQ
jgi:hypothetical protein